MSDLLLSATGISKTYTMEQRPVDVLKGVRLDVFAGEMVAVVGASGTGKSTLLGILGTLDTPTAGSVSYRGRDLFAGSEAERARFRNQHLGFVFQFSQLLPEFDALNNAAMPLLLRRDPEAREQACAALEQVGLAHRLHHRPGELSGGEQQRVAIARALIGGPELVLADEPTGNLDSHTGSQVFDMFVALTRQAGVAVLMVTHNNELAARCDRRMRMLDGLLYHD
ncbi:MAG: ABC transporter ATP-binding protein [Nitrospirota bacterium]|nr:ABC transporter ATP-binding protein [Nitrospirota bacterium]